MSLFKGVRVNTWREITACLVWIFFGINDDMRSDTCLLLLNIFFVSYDDTFLYVVISPKI